MLIGASTKKQFDEFPNRKDFTKNIKNWLLYALTTGEEDNHNHI
jgi:hypothetical protein